MNAAHSSWWSRLLLSCLLLPSWSTWSVVHRDPIRERVAWPPTSHRIAVASGDQASLWIAVPLESEDLGLRLLEQAVRSVVTARFPDTVTHESMTTRHGTVFGFTGVVDEVVRLNATFEGWAFSEVEDFDPDELRLLRDRALLRSDDEARVLPGDRLRAHLGGRPGLSADSLRRLRGLSIVTTHELLRRTLERRGIERLFLGGPDLAPFEEVEGPRFPLAPGRPRLPTAGVGREPFPRLDAPYRQEAFDWRADSDAERVLAAVAESVLEFGAVQALTVRGGEVAARFRTVERPFLDDLLLLGRRGVDGDPLSRVAAELREFRNGFTDSEAFLTAFGFTGRSANLVFAPTERLLASRIGLHRHAKLRVETWLRRVDLPSVDSFDSVDAGQVQAFLRSRLATPLGAFELQPASR